jgi:hypothetical protein
VAQLKLTPDQTRQIWLLHHLYTHWLLKLLAERARHTATLAHLTATRTFTSVRHCALSRWRTLVHWGARDACSTNHVALCAAHP